MIPGGTIIKEYALICDYLRTFSIFKSTIFRHDYFLHEIASLRNIRNYFLPEKTSGTFQFLRLMPRMAKGSPLSITTLFEQFPTDHPRKFSTVKKWNEPRERSFDQQPVLSYYVAVCSCGPKR